MMNRLKEPGLNFNSDTANQHRLYAIEISMNLFDAVKSIQPKMKKSELDYNIVANIDYGYPIEA